MAEMRDSPPSTHPRLLVWGSTTVCMVAPLLAVRGFDPADWEMPENIILLGGLLLGVGIAYEVARWVSDRRAYLAGAGLALWTAFLTVWINLAVGIIGSEDNHLNLL